MDSDSTFHPASQLNLAFASPMTPMCVKTSYNVVYGCDAVPRMSGMLKYLGALVEHVAPKILEEKLKEGVEGVIEGAIEKKLGYKSRAGSS